MPLRLTPLLVLTACTTPVAEPLTRTTFYDAFFAANCALAIRCDRTMLNLDEDATVATCVTDLAPQIAREIQRDEDCAFFPDKAEAFLDCVNAITCADLKRSDLDCDQRAETFVCEKQDTGSN